MQYHFLLTVGERLFPGAEENDFIFGGDSVRRFRDAEKIEIKEDACLEIDIAEGLPEQLAALDVDIAGWKSSLASLQRIDENVIIEKEDYLRRCNCGNGIGKCRKTKYRSFVYERKYYAANV